MKSNNNITNSLWNSYRYYKDCNEKIAHVYFFLHSNCAYYDEFNENENNILKC
jgi:hypothetical protein